MVGWQIIVIALHIAFVKAHRPRSTAPGKDFYQYYGLWVHIMYMVSFV